MVAVVQKAGGGNIAEESVVELPAYEGADGQYSQVGDHKSEQAAVVQD